MIIIGLYVFALALFLGVEPDIRGRETREQRIAAARGEFSGVQGDIA